MYMCLYAQLLDVVNGMGHEPVSTRRFMHSQVKNYPSATTEPQTGLFATSCFRSKLCDVRTRPHGIRLTINVTLCQIDCVESCDSKTIVSSVSDFSQCC
jgi:hypothetical protein